MRARSIAVSLLLLGTLGVMARAGTDAGGEARAGLASASALRAAPSHAAVAAEVDRALDAARILLGRADKLRELGDSARATLAEEAALEWVLAAHAALDAHALVLDGDRLATTADSTKKKADAVRIALDGAIARRAALVTEAQALDDEATKKAMESLSQKPPPQKGKPGKGGKP